jgi:carboxylesterase type B
MARGVEVRELLWRSCSSTNMISAPVLVNIFGGGYVIGDKNSQGDPSGLLTRSKEGIIYVTFNYRLGLYV